MEERRRGYGVLKMVILSMVLSRGKAHGYEVYKTLENLACGAWRPSQGTLYRVLNEMVDEGLLRKEVVENRRRIAYYTATEKGIGIFLEMLREFIAKLGTVLPLAMEALARIAEDRRGDAKINDVIETLGIVATKLREYVEKLGGGRR